ncbi:hypothetical protein BC940DRAFT_308550 [Gongronella butleri]|nr:hypothetical protein BC940DRAFT_308550 [Gongronella butleri]
MSTPPDTNLPVAERASPATAKGGATGSEKKEATAVASTTAAATVQDDYPLQSMEATIQSVFDALQALSQQHQPQHQQPVDDATERQDLQRLVQAIKAEQADRHATAALLAASTTTTTAATLPSISSSSSSTTITPVRQKSYPADDEDTKSIDDDEDDPMLSPEERQKQMQIRQKVRDENRARKRRWRQHNEERNKDNDLRCRVNKRARKLFGDDPSDKKQQWINEEFERRRYRRHEKERRKQAVNGALANIIQHADPSTSHSAVGAATGTTATTTATTDESLAQLQQKLVQHYQSVFGLDQEPSKHTTPSVHVPAPAPAPMPENVPPPAPPPTLPPPSPATAAAAHHEPTDDDENAHTSSSSSENPTLASTTAALLAALQNPQLIQLSQLLAQSLTSATLASMDKNEKAAKNDDPAEQVKLEMVAAELMKQASTTASQAPAPPTDDASSSSTSTAPASSTSQPVADNDIKEENEQDIQPAKKPAPDGSMDAVMTLMQLNAGNRP